MFESYSDANFRCHSISSFNIKVGMPFSSANVLRGTPMLKRQQTSRMSLFRSSNQTQAVGRSIISLSDTSRDIELLVGDDVFLSASFGRLHSIRGRFLKHAVHEILS